MSEKICKIVYFDEDSVTDYIQIMEGGELKKTTELLKTREASENQKFDVKAKAGISGVFKALLGWEASAGGEVSAELGFRSDKMVKNIILEGFYEYNEYVHTYIHCGLSCFGAYYRYCMLKTKQHS